MMHLPSREQIFLNTAESLTEAYRELGDAQDWLRSDWQPIGAMLTRTQAQARIRMHQEIADAKAAINRAKNAAREAGDPDV